MTASWSVLAINTGRMICLMSDGQIIPIVAWLDEDGAKCPYQEAQSVVAGCEEFGWFRFDLSRFKPVTIH